MYRYGACGLKNIWLVNGFTLHKTSYGKGVAIDDLDGLHQVIALNLVTTKHKLSGAELRFLRQEMKLSQASLAVLLGNNMQSIALWEKHGKLPVWADKFIRLIYLAHADDDQSIRNVVNRLNELDRSLNEKLVFTETKKGWKVAPQKMAA